MEAARQLSREDLTLLLAQAAGRKCRVKYQVVWSSHVNDSCSAGHDGASANGRCQCARFHLCLGFITATGQNNGGAGQGQSLL